MAISTDSGEIALNQADLEELHEQAQQQGKLICQPTDFGTQINLPEKIGIGGDRLIHLRGGLTIHIRNARLRQTLRVEQQHEPVFPLTAKFYLSGASKVQTQGIAEIKADYEELTGCNYLYCLPDLTEVEEWRSNEVIQVVMVYAKADYFRSFNLSDAYLSEPLRNLFYGNKTQRFHQSLGQTTPAMNQVLQQILHSPYQGITQQLHLESKALELLTLQFARWSNKQPEDRVLRLQPDEIERLHAAKQILTRNFSNPPTLMEIARQVGLNDCKLKQGFRQVFGTTVFGYLQTYRMEQAKRLLAERSLSVAGIAHAVGYTSPSRFCDAFKRQFSITPKAYQIRLHS